MIYFTRWYNDLLASACARQPHHAVTNGSLRVLDIAQAKMKHTPETMTLVFIYHLFIHSFTPIHHSVTYLGSNSFRAVAFRSSFLPSLLHPVLSCVVSPWPVMSCSMLSCPVHTLSSRPSLICACTYFAI